MSLWCFYNSSHCIELVCCQPDIFVVFHYSPRHNSAHMLVLSHSRQYYTLHTTRHQSLTGFIVIRNWLLSVWSHGTTGLPDRITQHGEWRWLLTNSLTFPSSQRNEMETLVRTLSQCPISHPCMCTAVKDDSRKKKPVVLSWVGSSGVWPDSRPYGGPSVSLIY